uniref:DNA mismatch repair protein MSH5 n=1 Tax=Talaromyces marneffei PM1 TaxID=1077442 RepID=A0A093V679_TALMA
MALSKRKRDPGPRNSLRASSAQRRFATDPVNPLRLRPLSPDTFITSGLEHVQSSRQHGLHPAVDEDENLVDDLGEVVMGIDIKEEGTVGCCFYIAREERLSILSDVQFGGKDFIDTLKVEINPTTILTSTRAEEATMNDIRQFDNALRLPYRIDVRPIQEYSVDGAKAKLAELEIFQQEEDLAQFLVPGDGLTQQAEEVIAENAGFSFEKGKLLRLGGIVDIENSVSLGCTGAVLASVETFFLKGTMHVNLNTLSSLQIMQTESHPNSFNQGPRKTSSRAKEDLSLYGLFHQHLLTPQGKSRLRQYFLRPSVDLDVISKRHKILDLLLLPANKSTLQKMCSCLKKVKNMCPVMTTLHKGLSSAFGGFKGTIWGSLLNFATHTLDLQEAVREMGCQDMVSFRERIDIEDSQEQQRTVIKQGVDRDLDLLKTRYNGLDGLLKQVAIDVASTIPANLQIEVNVIYFPQLGFNIAIPFDTTGRAAYTGSGGTWEQVFTTENRAYFKDERMRELDEKLGDIYSLVCEREIEIAHEIAQNVLKYEKVLSACSELCGELDCYLAMAKTAEAYKFARPQMSTENVIRVEGGRHPLQELMVASYIPNDVNLQGGCGIADHEQVALIVYLAHIGSTPETVSKIQSTFTLDLQQISLLLKFSTRRSLIIIDEFGKGTDLNDGAGLACGIFEYLLSLGGERPKVLAATHFHEIFENRFLPERPSLGFGHMEVRVDEEIANAKEEVAYLYNFKPGRSNQSFGTLCAAMNGVGEAIVARASELVSLSARGQDLVTACARMSKQEEAILETAVRAISLQRKYFWKWIG